ncbi:sigma 54-interacting transcriptional regulator, partial [bacterium]|nr:sigma 54-interacting transcriptional regulator [bacterium]
SVKALNLKMVLAAPFKVNEQIIGALYVDSISLEKIFTDIEKRLFELYSGFACVAIMNAQLYEQSLTDSLTNLPNSLYLKRRLDEEIARISRYGGQTSFLFIDLDNFKAANYTYGYLSGNKILKEVSNIIQASIRESDFAARFGGDEFFVILPQTENKSADSLAKRFLSRLSSAEVSIGGTNINLTASIGVITISGNQDISKDQIFNKLENALNISKSMGGSTATAICYQDFPMVTGEIVGNSSYYKGLPVQVQQCATLNSPCLISGETGVGKELIAKSIHSASRSKKVSPVIVNCAAIPETLFEDEFFGHEKGAFTGAINQKKGKFELADGGSLFLDEISEIPLLLQVKLLRVIENGEVQRVGGTKLIKVNVKIISATNRNLEEMVESGLFREDLFYRINAHKIEIPPLRFRKDDILPIAEYYIRIFSQTYNKKFRGLSEDAKEALTRHPWYGNIRELKYVVEKSVIICSGRLIAKKDIDLASHKKSVVCLKDTIQEIEKIEIGRAFNLFSGNITKTAMALGISRLTLRKKLELYDIVFSPADH